MEDIEGHTIAEWSGLYLYNCVWETAFVK